MFLVGDRVELINDFDNEPGLIPAGSQGTVVALGFSSFIYVSFDYLTDLDMPENTKHNNAEAGLPMFREEILRIK